ncbi:L-lactate permease [Fusobacterium sp.]|uniref:L-lactate permease n=1 Tax=Fusobacterium sp. TaxID=68766 RepID=UPI00262DADA0|nr:L-lactate permease [Fusobacterium sp.]
MLMFLLAILPILFLVIALTGLKLPGHKACPLAMIITLIEALFIWKQSSIDVITGTLEGFVMAIWPICLVIIAAVFTYNLVVYTKNIEIIKNMLASVSTDKRILVLIIAWGFGAFMEGMAGFGTAVAIPAGILIGLGFEPLFSAMVCLVANTTPVAFGSIGVPEITAASIAGLSSYEIAIYTILQTSIMSVLVPFMVIYMTGRSTGKKGTEAFKGIWIITLMAGLSFTIFQYITARFISPELPSILGSVVCMAVIIILTKLFKINNPDFNIKTEKSITNVDLKQAFIAWSPFIFVLLFLVFTSSLVPIINKPLASVKSSIVIYSGKDAVPYTFAWLSTPGVQIIIAAFIGGLVQRCPVSEIVCVFFKTIKQMSKTIITIMAVIATAKVMGYCGMIQVIADFIVNITGSFYPFVAPFLGSVGTFVTGSATSSSVLFTKLQHSAATVLNMSPTWMVASNIIGSTAGKIISPQSIAVATAATGVVGKESEILTGVIKYYIVFIIVYGLVTYFGIGLI